MSAFPEKTLVFGHRGASGYAPQNTLPAFELAAQQGADGIEFDVHLSLDGELVIIHDFTVDHTTNGSGNVHEMTLAQLKALDAGAWFDAKFTGVQVPTLDEVFQAVGDKLLMNIEIKADTAGIEQKTADCIKKYGLESRVIVSSFDPQILRRFRAVMPQVAIGFLHMPDHETLIGDLQHEARHPYHEIIDAAYMERVLAAGYRVNTWTVNDPARAVVLRDLGVNVIITDTPDVMIAALQAH